MLRIKLERKHRTDLSIIGELSGGFYTLELPWKDNQANTSCIPTGIYKCKKVLSPKFGEVFQIMDVPERDHILMHIGNKPGDTHGCVLVGSTMGRDFIGGSKSALKIFNDSMPDEFELEII